MVLFCFKKKKVGKYLETIGTCLAFSDKGKCSPSISKLLKTSYCLWWPFKKKHLFSEVAAAENQTPRKTVEPVAKIHKILKFRLALDNEDGETRPTSL